MDLRDSYPLDEGQLTFKLRVYLKFSSKRTASVSFIDIENSQGFLLFYGIISRAIEDVVREVDSVLILQII